MPIINPSLDPVGLLVFRVAAWATWAIFGIDYLARLAIADRRHYFSHHLFDLAVIALPLLRPLRLLRLVSLLTIVNRKAAATLRGKVALYVAGGSALLAFCGSLAVLDAERANPEANITDFGDAFWWAITTMTTVGYGDRYPTTGTGRLAAVALMIGGIALLGVVSGTLTSWLVEQVAVTEQRQTSELRTEVQQLSEKLDQLLAQSARRYPDRQ